MNLSELPTHPQAADLQACGDQPGLRLAADPHQLEPPRAGQRGFPGAQGGVGQPHHMVDAEVDERFVNLFAGNHESRRLGCGKRVFYAAARPAHTAPQRRANFARRALKFLGRLL